MLDHQCAIAVEFYFVQPIRSIWQVRDQLALHRLDKLHLAAWKLIELNTAYGSAIAMPLCILCFRDLFHRSAGERRRVLFLCRRPFHPRTGSDEKPFPAAGASVFAEMPLAFQLLAIEIDLQIAFIIVALNEFVSADVPYHDRSAAILALGNRAF